MAASASMGSDFSGAATIQGRHSVSVINRDLCAQCGGIYQKCSGHKFCTKYNKFTLCDCQESTSRASQCPMVWSQGPVLGVYAAMNQGPSLQWQGVYGGILRGVISEANILDHRFPPDFKVLGLDFFLTATPGHTTTTAAQFPPPRAEEAIVDVKLPASTTSILSSYSLLRSFDIKPSVHSRDGSRQVDLAQRKRIKNLSWKNAFCCAISPKPPITLNLRRRIAH